jgi:hypothetical protein
MITFESLHIRASGILLAQTRGELNFAVDKIIVCNEPSHEPDYDGRRFCGGFLCRERLSRDDRNIGQNHRQDENINANRRKYRVGKLIT